MLSAVSDPRPTLLSDTNLFAERFQPFIIDIAPDLLHVVPVRHDAVLKWIPDLEQPSELRRRLLADEDLALECAGQDAQVFWAADERGEVAFWHVVAREPGPDGARPVVEHDGRVVQRLGHGVSAGCTPGLYVCAGSKLSGEALVGDVE